MLVAAVTLPSAAQTPSLADPLWSGWAQCRLDTHGQGYASQQTQTWMMTGGVPTVQGAMRLYPATWSVSGSGSLERTQGSQTLAAQWTIRGQAAAPLSVLVRASDGRRLIQAGHPQLRQAGGITGSQVQSINGKAQSSVPIGAEAFEWRFPPISNGPSNRHISGASTTTPVGSVGYMQPGTARTIATCSWDFVQGGAAAPVPPGSTTNVAQPVPTKPAAPSSPAAPVRESRPE
jgi:hypothetical protein